MENSETVPFKRKHDASESQTNFNLTTNSRSERKPIPFGKLSKKNFRTVLVSEPFGKRPVIFGNYLCSKSLGLV